MSLNRNKSDEILLQLDMKVFPVNAIKGQERENMRQLGKNITNTLASYYPC